MELDAAETIEMRVVTETTACEAEAAEEVGRAEHAEASSRCRLCRPFCLLRLLSSDTAAISVVQQEAFAMTSSDRDSQLIGGHRSCDV